MTNVYVKISMWYEYVFVYKHMQRIMIYGSMMLACYVICICVYMYEIVWGMNISIRKWKGKVYDKNVIDMLVKH